MSSFTYKIKRNIFSDEEISEKNNLINIDSSSIYLVIEITNIDTEPKAAQVYLSIPTSLNALSNNKFLIQSSATTIFEKQNLLDISFQIKRFESENSDFVDLKFGIFNSFITNIINPNTTQKLTLKVNASGFPFVGAVNIEVE